MLEDRRLKGYQSYDELVKLIKSSNKKFDLDLVDKAYKLAVSAHAEQKRKSGIPYISHPVSVAYIIVELGIDTDSVVAALLHDVVEDTDVSLSEIEKMFGNDIANLIDGVTKIGRIPYSSREEQQAENLRKMLMAMANDIRVIIIKLADRLNNMRTIDCMPHQKQLEKSLENMEVYAPIAHRLGIRAIKEELEDISLRYLDPIAYAEIEQHLDMKKADREAFIEKIKAKIKERVEPVVPGVFLSGRVKSANGIYRKVYMKNRQMDEIFDIYAVRVIVNTVNDCYNVLGIVHDVFTPIPNRFKDYISTPKPNMYQSLHTTVIGKEGIPFEIQIRTWEMHQTAEYGIAAHWKYKLGISGNREKSLEDRLLWIRRMVENQGENEDATDLISTIKSDLIPEETYVFTPVGEVKVLPAGSTVIDFAYAIHSEVGNRMIGAKVDKRIVPIDYKIKTGEIVEILTTKEVVNGPSRDWLKIVKTSEARSKIRQWFKREKKAENLIEGRAEVEREFKRNSIILPEPEMKEFLEEIARKQHRDSIDSFYEAIGYGGIQLWKIMPRVREEFLKRRKDPVEINSAIEDKVQQKQEKIRSGVIIDGVDNCLIKFSKCCSPLPGDDIVGFVTRGYGVSIHKRSCANVPSNLSQVEEPERWIKARWANNVKEDFKSTLEIIATDREGLLADITIKLSEMHLFINSMNSRLTKDGRAVIYTTIIVNGIEHLKSVISKLSSVKGVISVERF